LALFVGDGQGEFFQDLQDVLPDFAALGEGLVVQEVGGMVGGHDGDAAPGLPLAAEPGDADGFAEESFDGGGAEGDEDFGADQIDLFLQVGDAGGHFRGGGLAVASGLPGGVGAALEDVGDVDGVAGEAGRDDDFGEELAGGANKRFAHAVFVRAGGLADEHEAGIDVTDAKDDIFAGVGEVGALDAGQGLLAQGGEGGGFVVGSAFDHDGADGRGWLRSGRRLHGRYGPCGR